MATRSRINKPAASKRSEQVIEEIPPAELLLGSEIQPNMKGGPLESMIEGLEDHEEEEEAQVSVLKWVPVTDGVIPDDAVEGGWIDSMPLFIGRGKVGNNVVIGYVDKRTMMCTFTAMPNGCMINSHIYEVLVNPGKKATIDWVYHRCGNAFPSNAFESCYSRPHGKPLYIGQHKVGVGHMFMGYVDPSVGVLQININHHVYAYNSFHILTIRGNVEIIEEIDHCTLDDIDYKLDEAKTSKVPVTFDEVKFQNHSSIEQQLKAHCFFKMKNTYCWKLKISDTDIMTKIDGKIPTICKSEGDLKMDYISYPEQEQPNINYDIANPQFFGKFRNGFVVVTFEQEKSNIFFHQSIDPWQSDVPRINVKMKLGERLVSCTKHDEVIECNVPPKTEVKVKVQAMKDVLEVPFTAHLRKVYKNGMTAEEDVRGTFTSETTAHITSTVDDEKII